MRFVNKIIPFIALFVVIYMVFLIFSLTVDVQTTPKISILTPQLTAIPHGFMREGQEQVARFEPKLTKIDPMTSFRIPKVVSFAAPLGTETGAFTYNAQSYWANNPHRRGYHTGEDLNGIGGEDSDLGDTVYAIADGIVVYSGEPSAGWGKVILIAHRVEKSGEECIIQSMYAHLQSTNINVGQSVYKGEEIGAVGNASGQYLAHLHFEIREGINLSFGPGYLKKKSTQISPEQFLRHYLDQENVFYTSLAYRDPSVWQNLEMKNVDKFLDFLQE